VGSYGYGDIEVDGGFRGGAVGAGLPGTGMPRLADTMNQIGTE